MPELPIIARPEQDIFDDLAALCVSPGYAHAIASFCVRDNVVPIKAELKVEDLARFFTRSRLIRTEISTLIGLLVRQPVDYSLRPPDVIAAYMEKTEGLLDELHEAMNASLRPNLEAVWTGADFDPFAHGEAMREPIFYGGESAYNFQYHDFARQKYAADAEWLKTNKGFPIETAGQIVKALAHLQSEKLMATLKALPSLPPEEWTLLPAFTFTAHEIAERTSLSIDLVESALAAFSRAPGDRNVGFKTLHDFNATNATPLLRRGEHEFILFQYASLAEALYEAPFFWMQAELSYTDVAARNRGSFTEGFARERLEHVFGRADVHGNVHILKKKGETLGEIDVLVLFGNRAVVLQTKSKRLTIESRKGNDLQIRDDFKKAVQDACDQAYQCAVALVEGRTLVDAAGHPIEIATPIKTVYPLCVVADHYPALAFQARQFLTYETSDTIAPPLVMDVFALDAIAEMLESPLRFLSYLSLRAKFGDKLMASHELTFLSHHLKRNLWVPEKFDTVVMEDDIAAPLDVAMAVRREGIPGARTPDGILTRFQGTAVGQIIAEIEARADPATIDLGLFLLELSEETVETLNRGIANIVSATREDFGSHAFTLGFKIDSSGLTIHCNQQPEKIAAARLASHCEKRKYSEKANRWFGLILTPIDGSVRFGVTLEYPWAPDSQLDTLTANMPKGQPSLPKALARPTRKAKVGRNSLCPCGSGRKYKKCCLPQ